MVVFYIIPEGGGQHEPKHSSRRHCQVTSGKCPGLLNKLQNRHTLLAPAGGESVSGAPEVSSCVSVVLTLQDDDSVTLSLSTDEDGR